MAQKELALYVAELPAPEAKKSRKRRRTEDGI